MKKFFLAFIISTCLFACKPAREKSIEQIKKAEKVLMADKYGKLDPAVASDLVNAYIGFANTYPKDSLAPMFLFKAAEVSNGINDPKKAIELYKRVCDQYNFSKAPEAYFLQGFIYENKLNDYFNAAIAYKKFLEKFPDHPMAESAQASLDNLGKTPEELIKQFEAKNATVKTDSVIKK